LTAFLSASRITGTTRPFGVSAANPTWKYCLSTRLSPLSEALNSGNFCSADTTALIRKASMVNLTPAFSYSLFMETRKASSSVISACSLLVTCGIMTQFRCRLAPEIFLMRDKGLLSIGPNLEKSILGQSSTLKPPPTCERVVVEDELVATDSAALTNLRTSSCVIRCLAPEPVIWVRSTPSSRANLRTEGEACGKLRADTAEPKAAVGETRCCPAPLAWEGGALAAAAGSP